MDILVFISFFSASWEDEVGGSTWVQDFKTSLGNIGRPLLKRKIGWFLFNLDIDISMILFSRLFACLSSFKSVFSQTCSLFHLLTYSITNLLGEKIFFLKRLKYSNTFSYNFPLFLEIYLDSFQMLKENLNWFLSYYFVV